MYFNRKLSSFLDLIMTTEDNTFDFSVRDRLKKECKERNWKLSGESHEDQLLLDMITYCSRGNQVAAVLNLNTTIEFEGGYYSSLRRLHGGGLWCNPTGWEFIFEFWKKCFIQLRVKLVKKEPLPSEFYHEVIFRDYGRFLLYQNFANVDAMETEASISIISLKNESDNFNNTFKEIMDKVDKN